MSFNFWRRSEESGGVPENLSMFFFVGESVPKSYVSRASKLLLIVGLVTVTTKTDGTRQKIAGMQECNGEDT